MFSWAWGWGMLKKLKVTLMQTPQMTGDRVPLAPHRRGRALLRGAPLRVLAGNSEAEG